MSMSEKNSAWITWENQVRNVSLSSRFSADFYPVVSRHKGIVRYLECAVKTIAILFKYRGQLVFVQNPSLVLALLALIFKPLFAYRLVVDAHNAGVFPGEKLKSIANFIHRNVNFVIVTNKSLADFVTAIGGVAVVLPDPLPLMDEPPSSLKNSELTRKSAMMVCSWAEDEPYLEVFKVAGLLPEIDFYFTGNSKGKEKNVNTPIPQNVHLTGFLSRDDYLSLLARVDLVLVLTTRENCLVCGGYEAVSAKKPVLLSNTAALREYFGVGAIYVENNSKDIFGGVENVFANLADIQSKVIENAVRIEMRWQVMFEVARKQLFT